MSKLEFYLFTYTKEYDSLLEYFMHICIVKDIILMT